jgi:dehydrogenase/reductase SDR family member 7B
MRDIQIFAGKTAWITGASSGIGKEVALELASIGAKLILSAREQNKLQEVAEKCRSLGAEAAVLPFDLLDSFSLPGKAAEAAACFGQIDILFNNGGISQRALAAETAIEIDRMLMEVNYFSGLALTKAVLPQMIQRKQGWIIANSSLSGAFGFPLRSGYSAAKHAVYGFYESLRAELEDTGVSVSIVSPGRINTPISLNAVTKNGKPHGEMDPGQANGMPVNKCAKIILKAAARRKPETIIGSVAEHFAIFLRRSLPFIFFKIVAKIGAK